MRSVRQQNPYCRQQHSLNHATTKAKLSPQLKQTIILRLYNNDRTNRHISVSTVTWQKMSSGKSLPTFRDNPSVPSSRIQNPSLNSGSLKMPESKFGFWILWRCQNPSLDSGSLKMPESKFGLWIIEDARIKVWILDPWRCQNSILDSGSLKMPESNLGFWILEDDRIQVGILDPWRCQNPSLDSGSLKMGPDRLSRNVGKELPLLVV